MYNRSEYSEKEAKGDSEQFEKWLYKGIRGTI